MQTSWEKITKRVGTTNGQDISNELQNKTTVVIAKLFLSQTSPEDVGSSSRLQRHKKFQTLNRT